MSFEVKTYEDRRDGYAVIMKNVVPINRVRAANTEAIVSLYKSSDIVNVVDKENIKPIIQFTVWVPDYIDVSLNLLKSYCIDEYVYLGFGISTNKDNIDIVDWQTWEAHLKIRSATMEVVDIKSDVVFTDVESCLDYIVNSNESNESG